MSVVKKVSKSAGKADNKDTSRKTKSGGDGKRKKIFAETKGTAHLIELSNAIADSQSTKLKERVDKAKDKARWVKEKRAQTFKSKSESGLPTQDKRGEKVPLSKSSIRADLLAKKREKTKRRKEARKAIAATSTAPSQVETRGKRVTFA